MFWPLFRKFASGGLLLLMLVSCAFIYLQSYYIHINTSPCACGYCPTDKIDCWFSERFNASYHPLMSINSSVLTGNTFKWWKQLQKSKNGLNYTGIVERLFKVIPDQEHYRDGGPDRCRACSVVGNSGNLRNSHYGPLIDSSDFVFRVNKGPIEGYEEDVGSRTTHRIIYPETAVDVANSTHLVVVPFKLLDLEWLVSVFTTHHVNKTRSSVKATIKADPSKVLVVNPTFMKYVHEVWLRGHGQYPSTGFMTVVLALHICDQVRIFGFGANRKGIWDHYFEKGGATLRQMNHGGSFEYATIMELHKRQKVGMYRGW